MFLMLTRHHQYSELRLATLEAEEGHYLDLVSLLALIPHPNHSKLWLMGTDHKEKIAEGFGSSHNHQAWQGGYLDHVTETMNIACQLYSTLNALRRLPFPLHEALEVMFLHDIEKPFKVGDKLLYNGKIIEATKENRKNLRSSIIREYGIELTEDQHNALKYVEGVRDSEYSPNQRIMGRLATFCHMCDLCSARLWHDKGKDVPAPGWE
jgi:hypothetical protein